MDVNYGERITARDANKYISKFDNIKAALKKKFPEMSTTTTTTVLDSDKEASAYVNSKSDAFVFSRKFIIDMLEETDKSGKKPEYLMIRFAAKMEEKNDINIGEPTLVILGCKDIKISTDGKTLEFSSMDVEKPGGQQPGGTSFIKFPDNKATENDVFEITFQI